MGHIAWLGILKEGWPVLSVLFFMSILTLSVCIDKWKSFSAIHTDTTPFLDSLKKVTNREKILSFCGSSDQPVAQITLALFKASAGREEKERTLHHTIQDLVFRLEGGLSMLGTIASVAPFVGLLGTVIGIIKSFQAVSMSAAGGASQVAIGISEALVGTAGGLVVAIPAVLAYNYFVNKLRRFTQDWELKGKEIIDLSLASERG